MRIPLVQNTNIRLGLCCTFVSQPIKFRNTTVTHALTLERDQRLEKLARLCMHNARTLLQALRFCNSSGIGGFRVNSQILPLKSHGAAGYRMGELPNGSDIEEQFRICGRYARNNGLRLTFHPDQFILLSSPDEGVTRRSIAELLYHAEVAGWIGADVITLHGGGGYGDRKAALDRVAERVTRLPDQVRSLLTLENDDRVFTPRDLLPVCRSAGVAFTYDVHHHRCLPDGLTVEQATAEAVATWDREPVFHLSIPARGWNGPDPRSHHDFINPADFPAHWLNLPGRLTVEIEAKAKEVAVVSLKAALENGATAGRFSSPA